MYKYGVYSYSSFGNYTVCSKTENVSSIIDRLIRIAAKITENYASDIVYNINDLDKAANNHKSMDVVLRFREDGVTTYKVVDNAIYRSGNLSEDSIQDWRLWHNAENNTTSLERVYLKLKKEETIDE